MAVQTSASTPQVAWVKYKTFSGCKIDGTAPVRVPTSKRHMDRAYYLTAQLEAPTYGGVQSYDGCGMSGGPLHNIAVLPASMTQGSLFALLAFLEKRAPAATSMLQLLLAYREQGWVIAQDGVLRHYTDKSVVSGAEIVDVFTPLRGVVPKNGAFWERAKRWALLHSQALRDEVLFDAQKEFAIEWLVTSQRATEDLFYRGKNVRTVEVGAGVTPEEDLALCVYHAYSVNGPGPARDVLSATIKQTQKPVEFARALIARFAQTAWGNWSIRHARTRAFAQQSKLWPSSFFTGRNAIFPARNGLTQEK